MTEIRDNLTYADGRKVNGLVVVWWQPFLKSGAVAIAGGMVESEIVDGVLDLALESNAGSQPTNNYYTAKYELENGALYEEYWVIPALSQASLAQVRVAHPVQPSVSINPIQLTSMGASAGMFIQWNGTHWIPGYVTNYNFDPNNIRFALTSAATPDLAWSPASVVVGETATLNVPDASPTSRGVVTTGAQTFGGPKTIQGDLTVTGILTAGGSSFVPATRRIIAGAGMDPTSGGTLAADVTLNALVTSVFGRTGAVVLTPADVIGAGGVPTSRQLTAGTGLTGGGDLSMDRGFAVQPDTTVQQVRVSRSGSLVAARREINFIPGSNTTVAVADDTVANNRVNVTISSTGGMTDPTANLGDLIVRGPSALDRLQLGANGQVLTTDTTQPLGVKWAAAAGIPDDTSNQRVQAALAGVVKGTRPQLNFVAGSGTSFNVADNPGSNRVDITVSLTGSGPASPSLYSIDDTVIGTRPQLNLITGANATLTGFDNSGANRVDITVSATGAVPSVFGRTGAVVAQAGDYTAAQVTGAVDTAGSYANPSWITSLAWSKITGAPATGVSSVFGRSGAVVATAGDYTAAQITNAVSTLGSYADPAWITSLAWSKVTGAPAFLVDPLANKGDLLARGTSSTRLPVGTDGQVLTADSTQALGVKWAAGGGGGSQTPWLQDIDGAGFTLKNAGRIGVGNDATVLPHVSVPWKFLIVGETTADTNHCGTITACGNSATSVNMGAFSIANYAITATEKRIGQMLGITDGAKDSGALVFATANAGVLGEKMRITAAGNVGIGTPTPSIAKLDVVNPSLTFDVAASGVGTFRVAIGPNATDDALLVGVHAGDYSWIQAVKAGTVNRTLALNALGGNVGIGATNPQTPLHVYRNNSGGITAITVDNDGSAAGTGQAVHFSYSTSGKLGGIVHYLDSADSKWKMGLQVWTNSAVAQVMTLVGNTGSVGIGTTTPLNLLQVHGATDQNLGIASQGGRIRVGAYNDAGSNVVPLGFDGARFDFSGGPVCIGTNTAPSGVPLTFGSGLGNKIAIWDGGGGGIYGLGLQSGVMQVICNSSNDRVAFGYGNSTAFTELACVKPNGIGVGTTNVVDCVTIANLGAYGQLRMAFGNYGAFFRNDGATFYLMATNSGDPYGTWKAPFPLSVDLASCNCTLGNNVTIAGSLQVGPGPVSQAGDIAVGRPASPTTGAIFFGNSASRYIYWDGTQFIHSGPIQANGNCNISGQYQVNGTPIVTNGIAGMMVQANSGTPSGPYQYFNFANNGFCSWFVSTGGPGGNTASITATAASDIRLKRNVRDLAGGLPLIEQVRPIEAEWNGLAGQTEGRRVVSVIAQDLQKVMPGAVDTFRAKLQPDDAEETDLLHFNPIELTMHLILAVQQLSRRVQALEGRMN